MPYLHMALTRGNSAARKRSLIREMTDCTVEVMEVPPSEVHVFLWEFDTENLGYGGDEPHKARMNNVTMTFREGRRREVLTALIERLTDVIERRLEVAREDVHITLIEVPAANIGEGGIPMSPPEQPSWLDRDIP
ncbi:tautomerase family protein [Mesorhizobium sp. CC13]|uniref:tautomerase family protein n=1 Tax=Mesorhizobium sp. CC13 TaxID=3029194 RepID=UPI003263951E